MRKLRDRISQRAATGSALTASIAVVFLLLPESLFGQTGMLPPGLDLSDTQLIARGSALFAQNCSVGYCHGAAGKAGRGPRLRGRDWDKSYLFKVTFEGSPNSSMPGWKDRLSDTEIAAVVAYILTLSKLTSDNAEPTVSTVTAAESASVAKAPASGRELASAGGSLLGDPEKGRALFFDSSNEWHCSGCHKVGSAGASVGPDLNAVQLRAARDLFVDIVLPSARLAPERPLVCITTKNGERIQAVKSEETLSHLKFFDIGSLPAVLRNLPKDQIQTLEVQNRSAMPSNYAETYTVKQLLNLIAFLKSGGRPTANPVALSDLQ